MARGKSLSLVGVLVFVLVLGLLEGAYQGPTAAAIAYTYNNYGAGPAGILMCRGNANYGNPPLGHDIPGGSFSQTMVVPAGVATINTVEIAIDPVATMTASLTLTVDGAVRASAAATPAVDTVFSLPDVDVSPGQSVSINVSLSDNGDNARGQLVAIYEAGAGGGVFSYSNSCVQDMESGSSSSNTLKAIVSGNAAPATQSITISSTAPSGATYSGSNSQDYIVNAISSSGLPVTLGIDPSSTSGCTISGGVVSYGGGVGGCVIDANQAGNGDYQPAAQVQQSFNVAKATQSITISSTAPSGATYSGSNSQDYTVNAISSSGLPVTLGIDPSSTSGCTISGGVVSYGGGVGGCVIDANQAGNGDYQPAAQVQQSFNAAKATPSVALTGSGTTITTGQTETLTCTVGPPGVPGTVMFYNRSTALNSSPDPVGDSPNNVATYSAQFVAVNLVFTCVFTPTDATDYSSASSPPYLVNPPPPGPNPTAMGLIEVTVQNGALTITTSTSAPVVLSTPVLNTTASGLVATGTLNTVTVTDLRAGNLGYTLTGQLSGDFIGSGHPVPASASDAFSGDDLGWAPTAPVTSGPSQNANAGPAVAAPLPPLAAGHTNGTNLLSTAAALGTATAGGSYGSIQYGAALTLSIPTNAAADLYQGALTVTAM